MNFAAADRAKTHFLGLYSGGEALGNKWILLERERKAEKWRSFEKTIQSSLFMHKTRRFWNTREETHPFAPETTLNLTETEGDFLSRRERQGNIIDHIA